MTNNSSLSDVTRILQLLQQGEEIKHEHVVGAKLDPQLALLRAWQAGRLAQTYADLLADPRYSPACRFFLSDIYAPRDLSQRDQDIGRLYTLLLRVMPAQTLQLLVEVVELNNLTNALDDRLLRVLVDQLGGERCDHAGGLRRGLPAVRQLC